MDEHELRKHVGIKIREFRIKRKITQKELGEKLGVKHNTISDYEQGLYNLDSYMLYKFANIFNKKVSDFFPQKK
ncbi:helix-turn-helix domain-containing protein [Gracilibacillus lacisalsi]|uniref:helix-turn-helix domain-containing protein n=1 Tax=Gracilibacillus lacisalsi TaxID=393087 RepID=UPI00037F9378|nr:helix-turn-helix transcriptional regulator [Gracilibacillus lacisalsi]